MSSPKCDHITTHEFVKANDVGRNRYKLIKWHHIASFLCMNLEKNFHGQTCLLGDDNVPQHAQPRTIGLVLAGTQPTGHG